jgi:hypothetical protein
MHAHNMQNGNGIENILMVLHTVGTVKYSNICIGFLGYTDPSNIGLHTHKISQACKYADVLGYLNRPRRKRKAHSKGAPGGGLPAMV